MHRFVHAPMQNKLITVGVAARQLNVSIDTLRRWDKSHRLQSIRSGPRGHRYYKQSDIDLYLQNVGSVAEQWASASVGYVPQPDVYCQTRDVFQARLEKLQSVLKGKMSMSAISLLSAVAGEIGNNSFDHNLGNWPDIPGIFFSCDMRIRTIILADRGLGILATLKRVKPQLSNASEALNVAFTETLSGRRPEARGNGLKFVRSVIVANPFTLRFQTGNAQLDLKQGDKDIAIQQTNAFIGGCFATIGFEESI